MTKEQQAIIEVLTSEKNGVHVDFSLEDSFSAGVVADLAERGYVIVFDPEAAAQVE